MKYQVLPSSPQATTEKTKKTTHKYPWKILNVGESFLVPPTEVVKFSTLYNSASKMGKKLGKRFRVIQHDIGIEVARLPDVVEQPKVTEQDKELTKPDEVDSMNVDASKKFW